MSIKIGKCEWCKKESTLVIHLAGDMYFCWVCACHALYLLEPACIGSDDENIKTIIFQRQTEIEEKLFSYEEISNQAFNHATKKVELTNLFFEIGSFLRKCAKKNSPLKNKP